jgi:hypothetical protein
MISGSAWGRLTTGDVVGSIPSMALAWAIGMGVGMGMAARMRTMSLLKRITKVRRRPRPGMGVYAIIIFDIALGS